MSCCQQVGSRCQGHRRRRALPAAPREVRPQTAKVHTPRRAASLALHRGGGATAPGSPPSPTDRHLLILTDYPPGSYPRLPRSTRSPTPLEPTTAAGAGSASDSRAPSTPPSRAVQPLPRVILRGPVVHWMDRGEAGLPLPGLGRVIYPGKVVFSHEGAVAVRRNRRARSFSPGSIVFQELLVLESGLPAALCSMVAGSVRHATKFQGMMHQ